MTVPLNLTPCSKSIRTWSLTKNVPEQSSHLPVVDSSPASTHNPGVDSGPGSDERAFESKNFDYNITRRALHSESA